MRLYFSQQGNLILFEEWMRENSDSAEWTANDYERVMGNLPKGMTCAGGALDDCFANNTAWKILESRHPDKFWYGSVSHGLNALHSEIISRFPGFKDYVQNVKDITSFVFRRREILSKLKAICAKDNTPLVLEPFGGGWELVCASVKSFLKQEKHLKLILDMPSFSQNAHDSLDQDQRTHFSGIIHNEAFLRGLNKMVDVLSPVVEFLLKLENDHTPLSEVYAGYESLKEYYENLSSVDLSEKRIIEEILKNNWEAAYCKAYGITYLLDPRYLGAKMNSDCLDGIKAFICYSYPYKHESPSEPEAELCSWLQTWGRYAIEEPYRLNALKKGQMSMYEWWLHQDERKYPHLRELALKVFSLPPSRDYDMRNIKSCMDFIRNNLSSIENEKVDKLMFVYFNMQRIDDECKRKSDSSEKIFEDEF